MTAARRDSALAPVLVFVCVVAAVISSLGAPLIPTIASDLDVSVSSAQWSLTAALLVSAVSAPILGRLGDGPRRRETFIVALVAVLVGNVLAALANDLGVLVLGRALQGLGLGMIPLAMAEARHHVAEERVTPIIALLSVSAAAGIGVGYPLSAAIADGLGLSAGFWFGTGVTALALVLVLLVIRPSTDQPSLHIDLPGAALLTAGLVMLLLAIAEGNRWEWTSATTLGLFAGAAVALAVWAVQQLHAHQPIVDLRLVRHPAVLTSNACAMVLGIAMYANLTVITEFVQAPGYGFEESVTVAGLCLVPFSITSVTASRFLPWLNRAIGQRWVLPLGSAIVAVPSMFFALEHSALWQAFVMMGLTGVGMGLTFAAIPGFIQRAVPQHEFGSAMGFYQVVRYIGFSLGSALTAAVLDARTPAGAAIPAEDGYTLVLWISVGVCAAAAVLAAALGAGAAAFAATTSRGEGAGRPVLRR